jgi:hypothetical protein
VKLNGAVIASPTAIRLPIGSANALLGATPRWIGSPRLESPPTGAGATTGRSMRVPESLTRPLGKMAVAPNAASAFAVPAMAAGFHHKEAAPWSATSPELARPHPRTDCS